ncbi:PP2C family serine/threonine-protein phosphatase [Streptomyces crystallinus]|uniref:PP2C family serine/threonine-protein phosphatase n=1 Tax=Streptomyces crystallinus TaxID=68191 RepID=A0ABP3Q083_9ACTN
MGARARGSWRVHGLSVEGYRHRRDGVPCQDAWRCATEGPVTVLAVADGAGSRPRSGEGSLLAVRLAVEHFGRLPASGADGPAAHRLLRQGFQRVVDDFLDRTGAAAADHATTLTVVVLAPGWLGHVSVGDGFVVLRAGTEDGERQFHLLPQPAAVSEYSNETVFLSTPDAGRWIRTDCVRDEGVDGVLLSTDGLAQAALSWSQGAPQAPNESFAAAVLRSLDTEDASGDEDERLAALLRSDRLTALNGDDKTLLRAVRTGGA